MPKSTPANTEKAAERKAAKAKRQALKALRIAAAANVEISDVLPIGSTLADAKPRAIEAANIVLAAGGSDDDAIAAASIVLSSAQLSGIKRDTVGIAALATSFGNTSERDESYLAMLASFGRDEIALRDIKLAYAKNPFYAGSAKSTDIGAFVRLSKAGYVSFDADTGIVTFTDDDASDYAKRCLAARSPADAS